MSAGRRRQKQPVLVKSATLSPLEVAHLLKDLCRLGFYLPPKIASKLEANPPRELEAFTRAVFEAKGMDPDMADRPLYRQVRAVVSAAFARVADRYGQEASE